MHERGPLLIGNRGEITVRVARTARALGVQTVGVVTEQDAAAGALPHADAVDACVQIASYHDPAELLRAARVTGASSVHPGYGFLSENAAFAAAVLDAGLVWIGPPSAALELMGDKGRAKELAASVGVPVVQRLSPASFPCRQGRCGRPRQGQAGGAQRRRAGGCDGGRAA